MSETDILLARLHRERPGFDGRGLEQILDKAAHPLCGASDQVELLATLSPFLGEAFAGDGIDAELDGRERAPQVVRHDGEQVITRAYRCPKLMRQSSDLERSSRTLRQHLNRVLVVLTELFGGPLVAQVEMADRPPAIGDDHT